jgi:predicted small integral membrane protein
MILSILTTTALIASALIIWFKTEAFEEYVSLIGGDAFFKVKDYRKAQKRDALLTYHSYLLTKLDSFFIRLITCPYCLGAWLCLVTSALQNETSLVGIYYVGSLTLYGLTSKVLEE